VVLEDVEHVAVRTISGPDGRTLRCRRRLKPVMEDTLLALGFLAVWLVVQTWLLPRLGVST